MQTFLLLALLGLLPQTPPFEAAKPGLLLEFPRDHGSHPRFKTEWWYFTGHFDADSGRHFGFELTFFRVALKDVPENPSKWRPSQLYPAHFAISDLDEKRFQFREKVSREAGGLAGSEVGGLNVWVKNWYARQVGDEFQLRAAVPDLELSLKLKSRKPPVRHGEAGFSRKGPGIDQASYYYSLTRLEGAGKIRIGKQTHPGRATAWMDHEFMSNLLSEDQVGWDWFSLQFQNGEELMLFQIRRKDGSRSPFSSGTWVSPSGASQPLQGSDFILEPIDFWESPQSQARYPIAWKIRLPGREVELEVRTPLPNQELLTLRSTGIVYWEGAVEARGTGPSGPLSARGYLEMTGYGSTRPSL